eukprot:2393766-Rhodomonas_salina.2
MSELTNTPLDNGQSAKFYEVQVPKHAKPGKAFNVRVEGRLMYVTAPLSALPGTTILIKVDIEHQFSSQPKNNRDYTRLPAGTTPFVQPGSSTLLELLEQHSPAPTTQPFSFSSSPVDALVEIGWEKKAMQVPTSSSSPLDALVEMGFDRQKAKQALEVSYYDPVKALVVLTRGCTICDSPPNIIPGNSFREEAAGFAFADPGQAAAGRCITSFASVLPGSDAAAQTFVFGTAGKQDQPGLLAAPAPSDCGLPLEGSAKEGFFDFDASSRVVGKRVGASRKGTGKSRLRRLQHALSSASSSRNGPNGLFELP